MSDTESTWGSTALWLRVAVLPLLFISGASGLVYEIAWERQLVVIFGNTMLSTSTILSAFMAGLALGSHVLGRYADRKPRQLLKIYAVLQAGIGIFALAFPYLLDAVSPFYLWAAHLYGGNLFAMNLSRFVICGFLITIPTFLMGGTLPVLTKFYTRAREELGHDTGLIYALNTAGALVGSLVCGFLLLENLGITMTTRLAAVANLLVAAAAWRLHQPDAVGMTEAALAEQEEEEEPETAEEPFFYGDHAGSRVRVLIGVATLLSGFCALAYEVFWARMLALVMPTTVYSFTLTLAVFVAGVSIGSLTYSRLLSGVRRQVWLFALIQISIGVLAFLAPYAFRFMPRGDAGMGTLSLLSAPLMTVPAILMGMAIPCAVQICGGSRRSAGTDVGYIYALDGVGNVLGPFVAGFLLIPWIGLQKGLLVVALLNVVAAVVTLYCHRYSWSRHIAHGAACVVLAAAALYFAPSTLFRHLYQRNVPSGRITFYKEGTIANIIVYDVPVRGYRDFYLNSTEEASTRTPHVQLFRMLGAVPVVVHEGNPESACMIAFGAGMSAGTTAKLVDDVDCVELNPDIQRVGELFKDANLNALGNPSLEVITNDGRNHLFINQKKYDLIISDSTNPVTFDAWSI
ncbi:MAG: fused MFS/spermidine synthase, partial [Planctomycetota bacterium]